MFASLSSIPLASESPFWTSLFHLGNEWQKIDGNLSPDLFCLHGSSFCFQNNLQMFYKHKTVLFLTHCLFTQISPPVGGCNTKISSAKLLLSIWVTPAIIGDRWEMVSAPPHPYPDEAQSERSAQSQSKEGIRAALECHQCFWQFGDCHTLSWILQFPSSHKLLSKS